MSASRNDFFGVIAAFFMQYQVLLIGSAILVGVLLLFGSVLLLWTYQDKRLMQYTGVSFMDSHKHHFLIWISPLPITLVCLLLFFALSGKYGLQVAGLASFEIGLCYSLSSIYDVQYIFKKIVDLRYVNIYNTFLAFVCLEILYSFLCMLFSFNYMLPNQLPPLLLNILFFVPLIVSCIILQRGRIRWELQGRERFSVFLKQLWRR